MLTYKITQDNNGQEQLETNIIGKALLTIPQLNKGTAFTEEERQSFSLIGKLPSQIENLETQVQRAYAEYKSYENEMNQNVYLNQLLDTNQILFYRLIQDHIEEMLPTIYTPVVGDAVKSFHKRFTNPRGLYITFNDQDRIEEILENRTNPQVDLIVVSDGEGVLGIGDQGVGAMAIPVAKLMVYTLAGSINPNHTLPIILDTGTNNEQLLNDPLYLGWRHPRVSGEKYELFIKKFIAAVQKKIPNVFLHWEDFGKYNAFRNLENYRDQLCTFNDDIQGTGIVAVSALLTAVKKLKQKLSQQRFVIFGAGSAGVGITDAICREMVNEGLNEAEARKHFWLIDSKGLLTTASHHANSHQKPYLRTLEEVAEWKLNPAQKIELSDVVKQVKPTALIGTSAVTGAFNEQIIKTMAEHTPHPIIFPLSNPTQKSEANPEDIVRWTQNRALIAAGSPFPIVHYNNEHIFISQCNNYFAFPGLGLGVIATKAKRITNKTLSTAAHALTQFTLSLPHASLLPTVLEAKAASREIAIAVTQSIIDQHLASIEIKASAAELVDRIRWEPHYIPYKKVKF